MNIPDEAIQAAAKAIHLYDVRVGLSTTYAPNDNHRAEARAALDAAASLIMAAILEDCADTAETDGLITAAEVIYDLRRHAKDLRPRKDA